MEVRSDASSPGDAERESTAAAPFTMAAAMHCRQCSPKFTMLKSTSSGPSVMDELVHNTGRFEIDCDAGWLDAVAMR